jgi:Trypsin-like peptidase domain
MTKLFRLGGCLAVLLLVGGYVAWRLVAIRDFGIHEAEFRKRLHITAENIFGTNQFSNAEDALRIYGVNVVHTTLPFRNWFVGYGIYLGDGAVLSAAHVVGRLPFLTHPRVFIAGQDLAAKVIKEGSPDGTDLVLLSVDQARLPPSLRLRREPICKGPVEVGTSVIVVYPQKIVRTRIISPMHVMRPFRSDLHSLINEREGSGSGVFDSNKKCLLGIISEEIPKLPKRSEQKGPINPISFAGYFVPISSNGDFLPARLRE